MDGWMEPPIILNIWSIFSVFFEVLLSNCCFQGHNSHSRRLVKVKSSISSEMKSKEKKRDWTKCTAVRLKALKLPKFIFTAQYQIKTI